MRSLIFIIIAMMLAPLVAADYNLELTPVKDTFKENEGVKAELKVSDEVWDKEDLDLNKIKGGDDKSIRAREDPGSTIDLGRAVPGNEYGVEVVKLGGPKNRNIEEVLEKEIIDVKIKSEDGREKREKPGEFTIEKINGENADKTNKIPYHPEEPIKFTLEGIDIRQYMFKVKIDGEGDRIPHERATLTPHSSIDKGQHTLEMTVMYRDEPIHTEKTKVEVTKVKDEVGREAIDAKKVQIASINGENADQLNSFELKYNQQIPIKLEGLDTKENTFEVKIKDQTIARVSEGNTEFRPRKNAEVAEGKAILKVVKRTRKGKQTLAETEVEITSVNLQRDKKRDTPDVNPEEIAIASINGEDPGKVNKISLTRKSTLKIEMENFDLSERRTFVKIGDEKLSLAPDQKGELRPRPDKEVEKGEQNLKVLYRIKSELETLGETQINIEEFSAGREHSRENKVSDAEFKILQVNGKKAEGTVKLQHDLRGEVPVELKVKGLEDADVKPNVQFKGHTLGPGTHQENTLYMHHLPRIEKGETSELALYNRIGDGEKKIYDSVQVKFEHKAGKTHETSIQATEGNAQKAKEDKKSGEQEENNSKKESKEESSGGFLQSIFGGSESKDDKSNKQEESKNGGILNSVAGIFGIG